MREQVDPVVLKRMQTPYILARTGNWDKFNAFFGDNKDLLDKPVDLHQSTPFHYAAHSGKPGIYRKLLGMVSPHIQGVLTMQDDIGNTPLHEVSYAGDLEMAISILEYEDEGTGPLLDKRNDLGETPVYRAAALGNTNLLKYFIEELGKDLSHKHVLRTKDKQSILHTTVLNNKIGTALWLVKRYKNLVGYKEDQKLTALQLLATMPSVFKSQTQLGTFKKFIYLLLPNYQDINYFLQNKDDTWKGGDLESGKNGKNQPPQTQRKLSACSWMSYAIWKALAKEWKGIEELWTKKEMHQLAKELVYLLASEDKSCEQTSVANDRTVSMGSAGPDANETKGKENKEKGQQEERPNDAADKRTIHPPLLMAASNGIMEIVEAIIELHPQSIEQISEDEKNVLHMAVDSRQLEIFELLKILKMDKRLAGKIDKSGNTVLHYTADFRAGRQPGYALQLQEELCWFDRIEKRIPHHYTMHRNKENKTARQLFIEKHENLLKKARQWMKDTAQSCSTVAVLVATVVFAAAYTVPGGTNESGLPMFLHHPIFLVFTVMDVVSLASSLASMVMFLSILTSPCEMWDFRRSLPRKLTAGFSSLFFSMATTMVSFGATILINIKLENHRWTSSLTYFAAFFPVCMFAVMQFPLYLSMKGCVLKILKRLKKISPRFFQDKLTKKKIKWKFSNSHDG